MPQIPENILDEILNRLDIVEVISGYIPLKRAGRNFKATCPFHHEKTPSFMVSPQKQIYHCFGCQAGGNAFNFLMNYERLEFPEAVEILAKKTGVVLPKKEIVKKGAGADLYKVNELTAAYYQNNLNSSTGLEARNYLKGRHINSQTLKTFKIGLSQDKWDALINFLRQKNFSLSLIEKAGLALTKTEGGYYDRFRNRIIFPIFDVKSRVLGFGGRIMKDNAYHNDSKLAKYINSPQTPLYTKGRHLYGLNLAKEAIVSSDCVVIVEGYLDCILPYQEGLRNVVASLGTALTPDQAKAIKRYTNNVIMVYDADDAGQIATLRSLDIFLEEDMQVKVVALPKGLDPDLFVRKYGIDAFRKMVSGALKLFDYKLDILRHQHNAQDAEGKLKISLEMLATIKKINNPILRSSYIKRLSEDLEIKEEVLLFELSKIKDYSYSQRLSDLKKKSREVNPTEKLLVKLMLEEERLIKELREILSPADFQDQRTAKIVSILFNAAAEGKKVLVSNLINHLSQQEDLTSLICELTAAPGVPEDKKEEIVGDCVERIKKRQVKLRIDNLHQRIKSAQERNDQEVLNSLMQEFCRLTKNCPK